MKKQTLSIETKVLAGFALAFALLVAFAVTVWKLSLSALEAANFVVHTQEVLTNLSALQSQYYRAESSQRAYLISGGADYLTDRNDAITALDASMESLTRLTADK